MQTKAFVLIDIWCVSNEVSGKYCYSVEGQTPQAAHRALKFPHKLERLVENTQNL